MPRSGLAGSTSTRKTDAAAEATVAVVVGGEARRRERAGEVEVDGGHHRVAVDVGLRRGHVGAEEERVAARERAEVRPAVGAAEQIGGPGQVEERRRRVPPRQDERDRHCARERRRRRVRHGVRRERRQPTAGATAATARCAAGGPGAGEGDHQRREQGSIRHRRAAPRYHRGTEQRTVTSGLILRVPSIALYGLMPKSGWWSRTSATRRAPSARARKASGRVLPCRVSSPVMR